MASRESILERSSGQCLLDSLLATPPRRASLLSVVVALVMSRFASFAVAGTGWQRYQHSNNGKLLNHADRPNNSNNFAEVVS